MKTMGKKIRERRKELGLTQIELAKEVRVNRVSLSQWESDINKPRGENLYNLARALQCEPSWLLGERKAPTPPPGQTVRIEATVPLISNVQAGQWREVMDNFQPGDAEEWRETTAKVSPSSFALRVEGDSMVNPNGQPSIPDGSIVIVDPEIQPDNGKIVVAKLCDTQEATLKKLVIDGPNKYLMPLNPRYNPITINGTTCRIVGVVKKIEIDL